MKTGINQIITMSLMVLGFFGALMLSPVMASAAYFDTSVAPRCDVQINRTLQVGSEGVDVVVLQDLLNRGGFLSVVPNGHYGPATKEAVRAFQYENHLSTTGKVDEATLNALNERMCDTDLSGDSYIYSNTDYYNNSAYTGNISGVTYVDSRDPYIQVISPTISTPTVYTNPENYSQGSRYNTYGSIVVSNNMITPNIAVSGQVYSNYSSTPAASTHIASTQVIYSPSIGYTYGITPASGILTITTPTANATYNEGDTVGLVWNTSNFNASAFTILLENSSTGQSKVITTTSNHNASFILTKEILDAVCAGACDNNQQGSFRIVITTPIRDISGNVSIFRAAVAPITIKRSNVNFGTVSIITSRTPVNSNELFKLYVNIPTGASWDANKYAQYSFKIHAACPAGVTATIAGTSCGQDFVIPYAPTYYQSEIPASISNTTWYQQTVPFIMTVTSLSGQIVGTSQVNVVANQASFSW